MNVLLFGATGMVGQGVLRECLLDADVTGVLAVVRQPSGRRHPKLRELMHADFYDYSAIESELTGFDACLFCLGVSSAGMPAERYRRITCDLTLAAATTVARLNPAMTFIYVSGMGTDNTGRARTGWGRVKGETENALLRLPFRAAYMFRPGLIVPLDGIKSKTLWYRVFYIATGPVLPWLAKAIPSLVTTTAQVGRAMLAVAKHGAPNPILENSDINRI